MFGTPYLIDIVHDEHCEVLLYRSPEFDVKRVGRRRHNLTEIYNEHKINIDQWDLVTQEWYQSWVIVGAR